jgi:hypothetical protein
MLDPVAARGLLRGKGCGRRLKEENVGRSGEGKITSNGRIYTKKSFGSHAFLSFVAF